MNKDSRLMDFDGQPVPYEPGQSIGAALINAGITSWRTTRKKGKSRGLFCGIGVCYDCLLTVDGQLNQRACMVPASPGAQIETDARDFCHSAQQDQKDKYDQPEDPNE